MFNLKKVSKVSLAFGGILIVTGILVGIIISSNLGWMPLGQAKVEPLPPKVAEQLETTEKAFVMIAKRVVPSVVNISTTKMFKGPEGGPNNPFLQDPFFRRFFDEDFFRDHQSPRKNKVQRLGSGGVVFDVGFIVTNNHVVEGAEEGRG